MVITWAPMRMDVPRETSVTVGLVVEDPPLLVLIEGFKDAEDTPLAISGAIFFAAVDPAQDDVEDADPISC